MDNQNEQETKSYRDPASEAGLVTLIELPPLPPEPEPAPPVPETPQTPEPEPEPPEPEPEPIDDRYYPPVEDCYIGFYQLFEPIDDSGRRFLAGAEGTIGSTLASRPYGSQRELLSSNGSVVGRVQGSEIVLLNALEAAGWVVECRLAYVTYQHQGQRFIGELAWMAYDNVVEGEWQALAAFVKSITFRIAFGSHPGLSLDQGQFVRVLRSHGQWDQTREVPPLPMPEGSFTYRRRRSFSDWLVQTAFQHRLGCNIATWVFLVAMLALLFIVFVLPRL